MNEDYLYQNPDIYSTGDILFDVIASIISFFVWAFIMFQLGKKANYSHSWLAFIPLVGEIVFFRIINRSAWNILWYVVGFIPLTILFVGLIAEAETLMILGGIILLLYFMVLIVLSIIWMIDFFRAFGLSGWFVLTIFVSIAYFAVSLYMAFSSKVQYVGINRNK